MQVGISSSTTLPNSGAASDFLIWALKWMATQEPVMAYRRALFYGWFNCVVANNWYNVYRNHILDLPGQQPGKYITSVVNRVGRLRFVLLRGCCAG